MASTTTTTTTTDGGTATMMDISPQKVSTTALNGGGSTTNVEGGVADRIPPSTGASYRKKHHQRQQQQQQQQHKQMPFRGRRLSTGSNNGKDNVTSNKKRDGSSNSNSNRRKAPYKRDRSSSKGGKDDSFDGGAAPRSSVDNRKSKRNKSESDRHPPTTAGAGIVEPSSLFTKLDPNDPVQANRIFQRRKDISKGKNTVGYHEYVKQIPKDKRRVRCMETPATPDPTLDISAKRWQGLIRAWRVALHNFDPPDLLSSFDEVATAATTPMKQPRASAGRADGGGDSADVTAGAVASTPVPIRKQQQQLVEDADGLLIDLSPDSKMDSATTPSSKMTMKDTSPISVLSEDNDSRCCNPNHQLDAVLCGENHSQTGGLEEENDDSDDDLL